MESKNKKNRLQSFFINIATSGRNTGQESFGLSDYLIRYLLMNYIMVFGGVMLVVFAAINFRNGVYTDAWVCTGMAFIGAVSFFITRTRVSQLVPAFITMICYGLLCVILVWFGEAQGGNFLFIYMYPLLTIMLIGMRSGIIFSAILLALISAQMLVPGLSGFMYHLDVSVRMIAGYFLVFTVMIVIESTRKTKDRMIETQNHQLQKLKEEADAANRAKSGFLAAMSHEIRTPMNAVIGIAQIQLQKRNLSEEQETAFEKIYSSGSNLLGIINDILDMSKIETGKMELNPVDYDVSSLINDAVQLNIVRIGSKPIEFILDVDENLPSRFMGDELRIKQILNNLLSNAIKYTEKGHVKLSIRHTPRQGDGDVDLCLAVEDTGQGMKSEDREKLFSEYVRFNTEANRATEGTGLGLAITRNLVKLMDGTIEVESEYGTGSVFTVFIRQKAVACDSIGGELSQRLRNFAFSGERLHTKLNIRREPMPYGKVLVVDDVETNLYVAEGLLSPYQLSIDTAISGFAALEKIESGKIYDIIFMDHMMPEMDGVEATQKIRAKGYEGAIVALTANALVGSSDMFKQNGFDDFIAKPIDVRGLNAALVKFVRDRHPEEAGKYKAEGYVQHTGKNPKLIQIFCRDAQKAAATLRGTSATGDMKLFTTTAHAMKSALANIGENELSAAAFELEKAGRNSDAGFVLSNAESFADALDTLVKKFASPKLEESAGAAEDTHYLKEQLRVIETACCNYDDTAAFAALDVLKAKPWKAETSAALEEIRDSLFLHSDFDGAAEKAKMLINR